MATEKTEPRIGLIVTIAVLTITIILGLRFFLVSYFSQMNDEENFRKSGGLAPAQLHRQRARDRAHLENGPVPITQAMQLIAQGGRPAAIAPEPSTDFSALQGWSQRPTGWQRPATPTINPGPTTIPNAPVMQGGPSSDNGTPAPAAAPAAAPAPVVAPAPTAAPAAAPAPAAPATGAAEAH